MFKTFQSRSQEAEIIDDFSLGGEEIARTLNTIEAVNKWLGGNQVLVSGVEKIIHSPTLSDTEKPGRPIRLLDLGTGSGDGVRAIADNCRKNGVEIKITAIDANPFIVDFAQKKSQNYPEIQYSVGDVFQADELFNTTDIVTCNLFLHHFTDEQILSLLQKMKACKVKSVLINDLHRHPLAYHAFNALCRILRAPYIARVDGLLSIRKGFTHKELKNIPVQLNTPDYSLSWKWAFRYQLILFLP